MNLQQRIYLLQRLSEYILSESEIWKNIKEKASHENGWFIPEFIDISIKNIAKNFLSASVLNDLANHYNILEENNDPKRVGIIMAGNIPLVGFHDLLCVFICGHKAIIKTSSKDETLIKHLVEKLTEWDAGINELLSFSVLLKDCDAYIATGSNNSSRYFDYYFSKYPNIIRRNRTSIAILSGQETEKELSDLADDIYLFFGLGCRNVTKIFVPENYDFEPLINVLKKYDHLAQNHKYKNNYDYNLALHLLNGKYYMSNESILMVEEDSVFSPISQLNYAFYNDSETLVLLLNNNENIQCIVASSHIPFGQAQCPGLIDFADGVDTIKFLINL